MTPLEQLKSKKATLEKALQGEQNKSNPSQEDIGLLLRGIQKLEAQIKEQEQHHSTKAVKSNKTPKAGKRKSNPTKKLDQSTKLPKIDDTPEEIKACENTVKEWRTEKKAKAFEKKKLELLTKAKTKEDADKIRNAQSFADLAPKKTISTITKEKSYDILEKNVTHRVKKLDKLNRTYSMELQNYQEMLLKEYSQKVADYIKKTSLEIDEILEIKSNELLNQQKINGTQ